MCHKYMYVSQIQKGSKDKQMKTYGRMLERWCGVVYLSRFSNLPFILIPSIVNNISLISLQLLFMTHLKWFRKMRVKIPIPEQNMPQTVYYLTSVKCLVNLLTWHCLQSCDIRRQVFVGYFFWIQSSVWLHPWLWNSMLWMQSTGFHRQNTRWRPRGRWWAGG